MKLTAFLTSLVTACIFISIPMLLHAQGNPGTDPDVPVDGGVSLLIAAGIAYGAKKAHNRRKKIKAASQQQKEM